ncbi:tight junction protein ZO-1-like [Lethenteron reissneri]|uniref:tight junction protein ZO-1-like n=1 Tax=Lethenteron reissneri TaxID=7753 RepID=UPI002AB6B8EB|nr:tight junction protein ZO-1-like [Lethenteron reissneri]
MADADGWEQYTVTLTRAPGAGFGIAVSGGCDNPYFPSGEASIVVSDVLRGGPADGLLRRLDRVVAVNGASVENAEHAHALQLLRRSPATARIVVLRRAERAERAGGSRLAATAWRRPYGDDDDDDEDDCDDVSRIVAVHPDFGDEAEERRGRRLGVGRDEIARSWERGLDGGGGDRSGAERRGERGAERGPVCGGGRLGRSWDCGLDRGREASLDRDLSHSWEGGLDQISGSRGGDRSRERGGVGGGWDRGPDGGAERGPDRGRTYNRGLSRSVGDLISTSPVRRTRLVTVTLAKGNRSGGYGLSLGSKIYVKGVGSEGAAARDGSVREGDVVLKINGAATDNMSLGDARKLIEGSGGRLKMSVHRGAGKTLTNMPLLDDSPSSSDGYD